MTEEMHKALSELFDKGYEVGYKKAKEDFARPHGLWRDYSDEGFVECPFCEHATNCDDNIEELHYCFFCGAELRKEGEKNEQFCRGNQ